MGEGGGVGKEKRNQRGSGEEGAKEGEKHWGGGGGGGGEWEERRGGIHFLLCEVCILGKYKMYFLQTALYNLGVSKSHNVIY